jgi:hypothetical protein
LNLMRRSYFSPWLSSAHLRRTSIQAILPSRRYSSKSAWSRFRIDIMTSVTGLGFAPAWGRKVMVDFCGESAPVLCRADVLQSNIAAGKFVTGEI